MRHLGGCPRVASSYTGPDRSLEGAIPLSDAERAELARRREVSGGREAMEIRFGGRDRWFEGHPLEVPADPR